MNIVIFGAAGHIGRAISSVLRVADLTLVGRTAEQREALRELMPEEHSTVCHVGRHSGNIRTEIFGFDGLPLGEDKEVDVVIYCVGHCPAGGFEDATSAPISNRLYMIKEEIERYFIGPLQVFSNFLPIMKPGGRFIFVSSAITRVLQMNPEELPPLHFYHHVAAIAAMDALIEGMRMDPAAKKKGITVHKIKPPAISDSPFYQGVPPPWLSVLTEAVVAAVAQCLRADSHQDIGWT